MSKRFLFTLIFIGILAAAAITAAFVAKGYRFSPQSGGLTGTGILSVTSIPDQASVYLDDHLTTATNTNINSLIPKSYAVQITKEGFIPWEKKIDVREGLVTEIKATLFRSIPTVYPLTFNGVEQILLSPDEQKLLYIVPSDDQGPASKRAGVWVWEMGNQPIAFARGNEQRQIVSAQSNFDFKLAKYRFSPDSRQVLATLPDRFVLLEIDRLNDPPRDITATIQNTLKTWDEEEKTKRSEKMATIKDLNLRSTASSSAVLKWSPDESKILYSQDGKKDFKVTNLVEKKTYDLPAAVFYGWLPDSGHLYLVEGDPVDDKQKSTQKGTVPVASTSAPIASGSAAMKDLLAISKISVIEYDGFNKSEIFAGLINPQSVFVWPDGSRLAVVSALATMTASTPNLYGVNLK